MAVFAVHKSVWNKLSVNDRKSVSHLDPWLTLGVPAEYVDGTRRWLVFSDHRFTVEMVGRLGVVFADPSKAGRTRPELDVDVRHVEVSLLDETLEAVLRAQGAPQSVRMGMEDSWEAVNEV